jgi:hypothetical protein
MRVRWEIVLVCWHCQFSELSANLVRAEVKLTWLGL